MKKTLFFALAALLFASCAKNEVVELNREAISFGDAFVENATRADYSSTDIREFKVYGTVNNVLIYDAANVTKGSAAYGAAWDCKDKNGNAITQYWVDDAQYKFAAVVDADKVNVDANGLPTSLDYTAAGQKDMLYNYVERKNDKSIVSFTFTHLLAKAFFTVNSSVADTNYTYSISDVKVTNAFANGVYSVSGETGTWTGSNAGEVDFANIESVDYTDAKTNAEVLLIPGASVGVSFTVTLSINNKEVTSYKYTKDNVATLVANNVYNFNISFGELNQIQFTVAKQPEWASTTTENL
ncbi:MAG: fimbrillin family protein [Alistipes sp.]|nr:fimbrillin family protein [Alistipes sp.]